MIPYNQFQLPQEYVEKIKKRNAQKSIMANEKGWHLKESVEKAVNTVLKEYLNKKK